jgi:hypothetical protein
VATPWKTDFSCEAAEQFTQYCIVQNGAWLEELWLEKTNHILSLA